MENVVETKKNGILAILSIIFGGLAVLLEFFALFGMPFSLGLICAVASIIMGIIAICTKNKIVLPVIGIILSALTIIFGILVVLGVIIYNASMVTPDVVGTTSNIGTNSLVGTWYDSSNDLYMVINSDKSVELYTTDMYTLYIKGTYTIKKDTSNTSGDEYIMNITTTNRKVDGELYTNKYTTQFSIVTEDYEEMVMMNTITYSMYYFDKID